MPQRQKTLVMRRNAFTLIHSGSCRSQIMPSACIATIRCTYLCSPWRTVTQWARPRGTASFTYEYMILSHHLFPRPVIRLIQPRGSERPSNGPKRERQGDQMSYWPAAPRPSPFHPPSPHLLSSSGHAVYPLWVRIDLTATQVLPATMAVPPPQRA